jgi:hypothetical protein
MILKVLLLTILAFSNPPTTSPGKFVKIELNNGGKFCHLNTRLKTVANN